MPKARITDPETSHWAAAWVTNISSVQKRIIQLLALEGPKTDEELMLRINMPVSPSGLRTRRKELVDDGVLEAGELGWSRSGRRATKWKIRTGVHVEWEQ